MDKPTFLGKLDQRRGVPRRNCKTCDGSGIATGHYREACRNPRCTGPMFIACPACAGIPFSIDMRCNFAGDCSPKETSRAV